MLIFPKFYQTVFSLSFISLIGSQFSHTAMHSIMDMHVFLDIHSNLSLKYLSNPLCYQCVFSGEIKKYPFQITKNLGRKKYSYFNQPFFSVFIKKSCVEPPPPLSLGSPLLRPLNMILPQDLKILNSLLFSGRPPMLASRKKSDGLNRAQSSVLLPPVIS